MRFANNIEKTVYEKITGRKAPACISMRFPFFMGQWWGFTLWKIILVRYPDKVEHVLHEMTHVDQFGWGYGMIKYYWLLLRYGYKDHPYEKEAYDVQSRVRLYI